MLWSKPPEVELAPQLQYMEKNATGSNISLNDFVKELSSELLETSRDGILVDMPQKEDGAKPTQQEVENGFSARFISYVAECIFYWRLSDKDGTLEEVRLFEYRQKKESEFEYKTVKYVRRLIMQDGIYINELYDDSGELQNSTAPKADGRNLNFIPFCFFGANANTPKVDNPVLYDLGQYNLGHFVGDADNRDLLHFYSKGITFLYSDMTPEEFNQRNPAGIDVGAKGINMMAQGDRAELLQVDANGALPTNMLSDEQRMIAMGAQVVQDVNTHVTLGAKKMEFGASVSELKQMSYNISEGVTQCLQWAGLFMGAKSENSTYSQNIDFITDELTPEMLNHFFTAVQSGLLPKEIYWERIRAAGGTKLENEEIQEAIEQQDFDIQGESEELARLRAENESLRQGSNNG